MESKSTCWINMVTKKRIEFASKCMKMKKNELNAFYSHDYIINKLIDEYLYKIGMKDVIKPDERDIKNTEFYLKRNRIDTDLKNTTKDDLKTLANVLLEQHIVDRKLTYTDVIDLLLTKYLEKYPNLKQYMLENRYIKQKMGMDELTERRQQERYDKII